MESLPYTVVRIHRGEPFLWAEHVERLQKASSALGIPLDLTAIEFPKDDCKMRIVVHKDGQVETSAELIVPPRTVAPSGAVIAQVLEYKKANPEVKTTEWLGDRQRILDSRPAIVDECLMMHDGIITEGCTSNLIIVDASGELVSSKPERILMGTVLQLVVRLFPSIVFGDIDVEALRNSKAVAICSTSRLVVPVDLVLFRSSYILYPSSNDHLIVQIQRAVEAAFAANVCK